MTKKMLEQPPLKPYTAYALTNWGIPLGVYRKKKDAIAEAKRAVNEPWSKAKRYFAVHRVNVTPL
jgi:hypothetical protein